MPKVNVLTFFQERVCGLVSGRSVRGLRRRGEAPAHVAYAHFGLSQKVFLSFFLVASEQTVTCEASIDLP